MKSIDHPLDRLAELPVEIFELSGKLGHAENIPVITLKPHAVNMSPPDAVAHVETKPSKSSYGYFVWIIYPHVVCYPFPDLVSTAQLKMENAVPKFPANPNDLRAIAKTQRYYKLSRLGGVDLPTPYGCHVRYGPWAANVVKTESCFIDGEDHWELTSSVIGMAIEWYGNWEDIPTVPNLTVVMGSLSLPSFLGSECCSGYKRCGTSLACIPNIMPCPDPDGGEGPIT